ncbi:hypothetical protein Sjap_007950 [Stephania japonica]|uniref:Uncharacterized protein n=1 Tax=Stephania japonica TaxID=461633 RepID=A0AAP0JPH2_9MAGN
MTASERYASRKGVSPMAVLVVVQYAQSILYNSSAQSPLASSNHFFRPSSMI